MDRFWLEKAHKYITEHNAFEDVSDIEVDSSGSVAKISAIVTVNLPSRFTRKGITKIGVKEKEEVSFLFGNSFPLYSPTVQLRDDFPRCFPHINPSEKKVFPCIYEGNLSELLQQNGWMNEVLNQLVDWLEKAASNSLMNYDQGWEPMRNDQVVGYIRYDIDAVLSDINKHREHIVLTNRIDYITRKGIIIAGSLPPNDKIKTANLSLFIIPKIIDNYVPNTIATLNQLYSYANLIGLIKFKDAIEKIDLENIDDNKIFVILAIKRPANIIGTNSNIEFLNFVITKSGHRKKKGRELKRTLPDCKVGMLSHVSLTSPALLRRISGSKANKSETKPIALLGCGSLGSKIGIHLVRNGNGPFICIDNDIFMPHNNARHALTFTYPEYKADLMCQSIFSISGMRAEFFSENAFNIDYSNSRIIIDTSASLSVRSFLMSRPDLPPIISCGLYRKGRYGLLLIENKGKTNRLTTIWADLYYRSLQDIIIRNALFFQNPANILIGQSCSSQTMVVDDPRISLMAATMSLRIQGVLENDLPDSSEIMLAEYDDNFSLKTTRYTVPEFIRLHSPIKKDWDIYIANKVVDKMKKMMREKAPNETGGALLGSVFLYPKTIIITGIIKAPPDSIETPIRFIMGIEGLEQEIKKTERMAQGKVTYLGTWHSHPRGGGASPTDKDTFKKLLFVRNYEPTVCLIVTENDTILV